MGAASFRESKCASPLCSCTCNTEQPLTQVGADHELNSYRETEDTEVTTDEVIKQKFDDEHYVHHHDHDPDHHRTDGYGSESDSTDEDVEVAHANAEDEKVFEVKRRKAVSNTKFGAWNKRFLGSFQIPSTQKSPHHHDILVKAIKHDELFAPAVERNQTELLVNAIEVIRPSPHTHLVDKGTPADALFIVLEGTVECSACDHGKKAVRSLKPGQHFGDESLMWHTDWTFTAEAGPHCVLAKMTRSLYAHCVVEKGMEETERRIGCLHMCKFLETFNDEQIAKIVEALHLRIYHPGDTIMREGQPGHHFFVVESGECDVFKDGKRIRTYEMGDLFGDQALMDHSPREETVVATKNVELLVLSRGKFERLMGGLKQLHEEHAKTDPRQIIAKFYQKGTTAGPNGHLAHHGMQVDPSHHCTSWFAVFRPTSRDAITKLVSGQGVGKGLNIKGKSAKKGVLSGFVPFLQISDNKHKHDIEASPKEAWLKIYYRSEHAREDAVGRMTKVLEDPVLRTHIELENPNAKPAELLKPIDKFVPTSYGLLLPETLVHEAYIELEDLTPHSGWETGRASEPAFMDMNMHAIRDQHGGPEVVLWQFDEGHPMNPHGLLVAYQEEQVKPVVSDFDAFLIASTGMEYESLPPDQSELAIWALERTEEILQNPDSRSWTERWLGVLHDLAESGEHHDFPEFGYGDNTSVGLVRVITQAVLSSGAIRHGAECFNFHFPQELDDEYLIVWEGCKGDPWMYVNEEDLRAFLLQRANEGFTFPINPVWPLRDRGWMDVLQALRNNLASKQPLSAWFPPQAGVLQRVDEIYRKYPSCFRRVAEEERPDDQPRPKLRANKSTVREDAELIMHNAKRKAKGDTGTKKIPRPHMPHLHRPSLLGGKSKVDEENKAGDDKNKENGEKSPRRQSLLGSVKARLSGKK